MISPDGAAGTWQESLSGFWASGIPFCPTGSSPVSNPARKTAQNLPQRLVALLPPPELLFEWIHWWTYPALAAGAPFGWIAFRRL